MFWLADHIRLFVHYTISLSSLCKLIWRHWTYKMPVRYILSSKWVRLSIFSQLSIIQYMGLCALSLTISLMMIKRIYTLSWYHHQSGSMNYHPLFRARSWNNGMCCMSLYILITLISCFKVVIIWSICISEIKVTSTAKYQRDKFAFRISTGLVFFI